MKKSPVDIYISKISRNLICEKKSKKKLLDGFNLELQENFDDIDTVNFLELVNAFGTPKAVSARIQENINEEECKKINKKRKMIYTILAVILFLALAITAFFIFRLTRQAEAKVTETIRIET